ncbi:copper amine oxidase N-terminal domain-containing protein [Cellulosilyticum lentocellum]|uniref:Copper amine oxidase-like domain-containing protein n=1 Tax=Cellulosilyticum lentocellum (strain ATCC 49066 / DSM 5427 / NCIMB 11756 / RHM5) TaxID=642492 RepID=F2JPW1_CELLD|nr:copper amine oxidase N-terminal domain-containing protein [Cellulosilyticum lentocellum]ADZ84896.1 copper amine oxidase-like domain-containing protein [Cellulosilyticum lentocellum DSM 5427]
MKKKLGIFLLTMLVATSTVFGASVKIIVNGEEVKSTVAPIQKNSTTLVPLRLVSEKLGAEVKWYPEYRGITISKSDVTLTMSIGDKNLNIWNSSTQKEKDIALSVAPQQISGVTMVPLRAISEGLGCEIAYENGVINIISSVEETYQTTENEAYIEKELRNKYSVCSTDIGNINMFFWVYENVNRDEDASWDYEVYGKFEEAELNKIFQIKDATTQEKVKAQLKAHMENAAKELIANHANVKFVGAYDCSYYEDVTDLDTYVPVFFCNWSNYIEDEAGTYSGSILDQFGWITEWDSEEW